MKSGADWTLKEKLLRLEMRMMEFPELQDFAGGIGQKKLLAAQEELGVVFPVSYQWFLLTFGMGSFGDMEIFGLSEKGGPGGEKSVPNLLFVTQRLRALTALPQEYLPVCGDGFGGYYCIKTGPESRWDAGMFLGDEEEEPPSLISVETVFSDFLAEQVEAVIRRNGE